MPVSTREILSQLDPQQMLAVTAPDQPTLVVAGPGAGKTRVLSSRVAWYIAGGSEPSSIVAFTFTNKAGDALRDRVSGAVGPSDGMLVTTGTFHSFGAQLLRRHHQAAGLDPEFTIYDRDDSSAIINRIYDDLKNRISPHQDQQETVNPKTIAAYIHNRKIGNATEPTEAPETEIKEQAYHTYQEHLAIANSVDFSDLIRKPLTLLQENPNILAQCQEHYHHILIDEYQDTNPSQAMLAYLLAGQDDNASIFVVGDPDQSIYGFQGADIRNILDFAGKQYPGAAIYRLDRNYRSRETLVKTANHVIRHNQARINRASAATRPGGLNPRPRIYFDSETEAARIAELIRDKVNNGESSYQEWCVAYRTNSQSRPIEEACREKAVPFKVHGSYEFFQRQEVQVAVCYLRLTANPKDDAAAMKVINTPRRGIGDVTKERITGLASENRVSILEQLQTLIQDPAEFTNHATGGKQKPQTLASCAEFVAIIDRLHQRKGDPPGAILNAIYEAEPHLKEWAISNTDAEMTHWNILQELLNIANGKEYGPETLSAFLERVKIDPKETETSETEEDTTEDGLPPTDNRVTLTTLHQSKGLEFPHMIIAGCQEGLLPLNYSFNPITRAETEEERRLFYVGCTRAMDTLTLTRAGKRKSIDAKGNERLFPITPSRFIQELDLTNPQKLQSAGKK